MWGVGGGDQRSSEPLTGVFEWSTFALLFIISHEHARNAHAFLSKHRQRFNETNESPSSPHPSASRPAWLQSLTSWRGGEGGAALINQREIHLYSFALSPHPPLWRSQDNGHLCDYHTPATWVVPNAALPAPSLLPPLLPVVACTGTCRL